MERTLPGDTDLCLTYTISGIHFTSLALATTDHVSPNSSFKTPAMGASLLELDCLDLNPGSDAWG